MTVAEVFLRGLVTSSAPCCSRGSIRKAHYRAPPPNKFFQDRTYLISLAVKIDTGGSRDRVQVVGDARDVIDRGEGTAFEEDANAGRKIAQNLRITD